MNKLTPIFIAGAIAISAGLVIAQGHLNRDDPTQGHHMDKMDMSGMAVKTWLADGGERLSGQG